MCNRPLGIADAKSVAAFFEDVQLSWNIVCPECRIITDTVQRSNTIIVSMDDKCRRRVPVDMNLVGEMG